MLKYVIKSMLLLTKLTIILQWRIMRNMRKWSILISVVAVILILNFLIGISKAQTYQEKFEIAKDKFEESKQNYKQARIEYDSVKTQINKKNLKIKTIGYLEASIDYLIAYLESFKFKLEGSENYGILPFDASSNLDKRIMQLENIRVKILNPASPEEFIQAVQDLDDISKKIILETRYYAGILINYRNGEFISNSDIVLMNLNEKIKKAKENDNYDLIKGGSSLFSHLPPFLIINLHFQKQSLDLNILIKKIRKNHEQILEFYNKHDGFTTDGSVINNDDAQAFLDKALYLQKDNHENLKLVVDYLREFFEEINRLK